MQAINPFKTQRLNCYGHDKTRQIESQWVASGGHLRSLMQQAGARCWYHCDQTWPAAQTLLVLCGPGANGGDGYALAVAARQAGKVVYIIEVAPLNAAQTDACAMAELARQHNAQWITDGDDPRLTSVDVVIDAMLGIGCQRPLDLPYSRWVSWCDTRAVPVLSIDLPSGLYPESCEGDRVIQADLVVSLVTLKPEILTGFGRGCCKQWILEPLIEVADLPTADAIIESDAKILSCFKPRPSNAHKGQCGHVVVVGGDLGMAGAAIFAAYSALAMGVGQVTVITHPGHFAHLSVVHPKLVTISWEDPRRIDLFAKADVIVVGPGCRVSPSLERQLEEVFTANKDLVIDAGACRCLPALQLPHQRFILTPHLGEARALLEGTTEWVERFAIVDAIVKRYGGHCVLKGPGTLIGGHQDGMVRIEPYGHAALASAGMGDVLAGLIAGGWAQSMTVDQAAQFGVRMHAMVGDDLQFNHHLKSIQPDQMIDGVQSFLAQPR